MHSKLLGIQAARGAAALLVVLYHASRMIALPQYAGRVGLGGALGFGHAGVDFFFVLSGFIIFYVHHSDIGMPQRFVRYAWRRVTRIYPSYWLVTAFVVLLMLLKHDPSFTAPRLVKSILLIPDAQNPFLDVAWTLVHEMLFYCFFAIMIVSRRVGILCGIAVLGFIVLANGRLSEPVLKVVADFRNLEFAIGMAAAYVTLKLRVPAAVYIAIAGAIGFVVAGMAENAGLYGWDSRSSEMAFALTSGVMIVGLAVAERSGTLRVGAGGRFVGAMSYMLYLIHTIAVGFTYRILSAAGFFAAGAPDWCGVALATGASLAAAAVLYLTFEKPVLSYLHKFRFGAAQAAA
jgi:exopolysaccharide production protein ExoZ